MMKKIICVFSALLLSFPFYIVNCFAAGETVKLEEVGFLSRCERPDEYMSAFGLDETRYNELTERLFGATRTNSPHVDLADFEIPIDSEQPLRALFTDGDCETIHLSDLEVLYDRENGIITGLNIWYCRSAEQYREDIALCRREADRLLEGIRGNDSLTDVQKALLIHDRLADVCSYEHSLPFPFGVHNIYGALVNHSCMCEGYTKTYKYLLDMVGIKNYLCTSLKLTHIWNVVVIDGEEYYVDVTWDDQKYEISGKVLHDNFLKSYEVFSKSHAATDYNSTPSSTKYDDYFWNGSKTSFEYLDGTIYYIDSKQKTLMKWEGEDVFTPEYQTGGTWVSSGGGIYSGSFSVLESDGRNLLYTTNDGVYRYSPVTKTAELIFSPDLSVLNRANIYGFRLEGDVMRVEIFNKSTFTATTRDEYTVFAPYESPCMPGDVDGDGEISIKDSKLMKKYLAGLVGENDLIFDNTDIDGDGEISIKDSRLLKKIMVS